MNIPNPPTQRSFAAVARGLSATTSRMLLSAVVVMAGVGVGRQVLLWWRETADAPTPPTATPPLGHPAVAHEIAVGDRPWSMVRQTLHGDAEAATSALLDACRNAVAAAPGAAPTAPGPVERELLASLEGEQPLHTSNGASFYSLREGVPLVVAIQAAADGPCVAVWGMAVPASPTSWSLYTFRPEAVGMAEHAGLPEPPLPPDGRRLVRVRAVGGDLAMIFVGPPRADQWRAFYDRWAADSQLQAVHPWRQSGGIWRVCYEATAADAVPVVHIYLDATNTHSARGVVFVGH